MSVLETFYDVSPVGVIDRNKRDWYQMEVQYRYRQNSLYLPMINWTPLTDVNAQNNWVTELIPGDVDGDGISMTANYIDVAQTFDSRMRKFAVQRYGDKVQLHKSDQRFNQWLINGSHDWRPLIRGILGDNVVRKHELLARNAFLSVPQKFWTYPSTSGSATSLGTIQTTDKFNIGIVNQWNLRLGQTGMTFVPGTIASAKIAIVPPGVIFDFFSSVALASGLQGNETSLWRDVSVYGNQTPILNYELGTFKNVRFLQAPNDEFGFNENVLYNCGAIADQYCVTAPINMGDGCPDPDVTPIDSIWYTGQKNVTHYITLEAVTGLAVGDIITIHLKTTSAYGVTGGVDILDGKKIDRRIVSISGNNVVVDRPIMRPFMTPQTGKSVTGNTLMTYYALVTKARHIGLVLVFGSRQGIEGKTYQPIQFYEPKPIDDFESVYRATWDEVLGLNIADPNMFECHFCAVTLAKQGGLIAPY